MLSSDPNLLSGEKISLVDSSWHTSKWKICINHPCECDLQLEEAENRLEGTKSKLASIRRRRNDSTTVNNKFILTSKDVKVDKRSPSPAKINGGAKSSIRHEMLDQESESPRLHSKYLSEKTSQSKPLLLIPSVEHKVSRSMRTKESGPRIPSTSDSSPTMPSRSHVDGMVKTKEDRSSKRSPEGKFTESQETGTKRKLGNNNVPAAHHFRIFNWFFKFMFMLCTIYL